MTMQIRLVERARMLAEALSAGATAVKRSTFESIISDFMSTPSPDTARLRRTLTLLGQGSGGHLKRGGSFPEQALRVVKEVTAMLDESTDLSPQQVQTLLGWTGRLLYVRTTVRRPPRRQGQPHRPQSRAQRPSPPGQPGQRAQHQSRPERRPTAPAEPPSNLDRKQAALAEYRRKLAEQKKKES